MYYRWSIDNSSWNYGNDSVDWNGPNNDSSADKGTETNFENCKDYTTDTDYMTLQEANQGLAGVNENISVDGFKNNVTAWIETGSSPYLSNDDGANYIATSSNGADEYWFTFANTTNTGSGYSVKMYVDFDAGDGDDDCNWYIDTTGDNTAEFSGTINNPTTNVANTAVISGLDTQAEINAARVWFEYVRSPPGNDIIIDYAYLNIQRAAIPDWELDMEYQFNNTVYNHDVEQLCFYLTVAPTETLNVSYRNGASWVGLGNITHIGWTNFTAKGLTKSMYNIRIKDQNQTNEVTQHSWTIDVIMLHTWNLTGSPLGQNWVIWSSDTLFPWSWSFNFPKGIGYYEFYSIGNCGADIESAPVIADAKCHKT